MGFLDKKERILDVVLTREGRKRLAQNDLDFTYYAFSDDGIDYSGSLDDTRASGQTLDKYIPRANLFEATSNNDSIKYLLYTSDPSYDVLPELKIFEEDVDPTLSFTIERRHTTENNATDFAESMRRGFYSNPLAAIVKTDAPREATAREREEEKANDDATAQTMLNIIEGQIPNPGSPVGKHHLVLNAAEAIDKRSGFIVPLSEVPIGQRAIPFDNLNDAIEVVLSVDNQELNMGLKMDDQIIPSKGFLIEVFESGSDGQLVKLSAEDVYVEGELEEVKRRGFLNFLEIETDDGETA